MGEVIYIGSRINGQRQHRIAPRLVKSLDASKEPRLKIRITQKTGLLARLRRDLGEVLFNRVTKAREGKSPTVLGRD